MTITVFSDEVGKVKEAEKKKNRILPPSKVRQSKLSPQMTKKNQVI